MQQRPARVVARTAAGVRVRYTAVCSDCGGCGGRCHLFAADAQGELELPVLEVAPAPGEQVVVAVPHAQLLRQSAWGYGAPLLGMLGGAALLQPWGNPAAALGALLGTSLAVMLSKRAVARMPAPRLLAPAARSAGDA